MDRGDIYLADLNEERRRRVLVVSGERFNRLSGRAIVAPAIDLPPDDVPDPWRLPVDEYVFAVDFLRALPRARLLEKVGSAPLEAVVAARRAIHMIT